MSTTTTTAAPAAKKPSLFDLAKKTPPKKETSKDKDVVTIEGISATLKRLKAARGQAKELEAEIKMMEGELKGTLHSKYMEIYVEQKKKPESFKIVGNEGGDEMLVIVQDKYLKVDEGKAAALAAFEDTLETKRTFSFDEDMLAKHEDAITEAIMNLDIPDEDKAALLVVEDVTTVKKGTIDRLMQYSNPKQVYDLIQPMLMLK